MFSRAVTRPPDSVEFLVRIGIEPIIDEAGNLTALRQPCHLFTGCCSIYGQKRPTVCGDFRCELLKAVDQGKYTVAESQQIVRETRALRDALPADLDLMVAESHAPLHDSSLQGRLACLMPLLVHPEAAPFREKYGKKLKTPFALLRNLRKYFVLVPPPAT
ncbi:MAG: hypothetical protein M3N54_05600 [Acidobacteriota bacterium]|nr:hypothetical protein [Acidobacteriota bacterium]